MENDYQLEDYDDYSSVEDFSKNKSQLLPPRSAIHGINQKKRSGYLLQMLIGSLVFIIIIAITVYFFISIPNKSKEDFDTIPHTGINESGSNNLSLETANNNEANSDPTDQEKDESSTDVSTINAIAQGGIIHTVESGENLYRISIIYYNSGEYYEELAEYNGLVNAQDIYVGMELKIPKKESFTTNSD